MTRPTPQARSSTLLDRRRRSALLQCRRVGELACVAKRLGKPFDGSSVPGRYAFSRRTNPFLVRYVFAQKRTAIKALEPSRQLRKNGGRRTAPDLPVHLDDSVVQGPEIDPAEPFVEVNATVGQLHQIIVAELTP
jgi:hypothetical protein